MKGIIPREILYKILKNVYFEYSNNLEEYYKILHSCMLVNKSWFIALFELIYTNPHFKSKESFLKFLNTIFESYERQQTYGHNETNFFLIRNYYYFVKHLHISSICYPSNDDIYLLSDSQLNLESLKLEDCRMLTDNSLNCLLKSVPNLLSLKLISNNNLTDISIQNIVMNSKKLIHLYIGRQVRFTKLGYTYLINCCPKLKILQLNHANVVDNFFIEWSRYSKENDLEVLEIKHCNSVTNKGIQQLLLSSLKLKKFSFTISNTINLDIFKINKICCNNIEYLEIDNSDYDKYEISRFQLTKAVKKMPHLKILTLIASVKIGSLGFLPKLIEAAPSLEKLYILPLSLSSSVKYENLRKEIGNYNINNPNQKLKVYLYK
ncbi:hypothetical protein BCR36DRAFT_408739 [Piromyces finnis]|uniref:RNI-like protein n=1 Tax=Piromyces finnis TaxID=1754191 RepID=A0A1Y1VMW8_9FUNG|nr:hypothetical protein BCR36DRAFT_408739 [Piromyces finnis]|eukprot:ORX59234.1 hypothetical protein BCR36DRAFT_408739 [Piromyces finnis]